MPSCPASRASLTTHRRSNSRSPTQRSSADASANTGLRDVQVVPSAERNAFRSGQELWDWLINSNPIAGTLVEDLDDGQRATLVQLLDGMIRERLDGDGPAILSNAVNIGIGRK